MAQREQVSSVPGAGVIAAAGTRQRSRLRRLSWRPTFDLWLIAALPAVITLVLVFVLPLFYMASYSLHRRTGPARVGKELTLHNYERFISDPFYLGILLETFWLGLIVVSICVALAYPAAYFLSRTTTRWRGTLIFLVVSPLLVSLVVRNLGFLPVLGESGLVNWALTSIRLINEPLRLNNNFTGVVIGLTHAMLPFMIVTLITVLQRIGPELEEAAINLGAGPIRVFWSVILPLSRPGLVAGYLVVFTLATSAYTTPAMLGGKRVLVMPTFIEQQIRSVLDYAFGATAAVVLLITTGMLTALALRGQGKEQ